MPDFIVVPSQPASATVTAVIPTINGVDVASSTVLYATTLPRLFEPSDFDPGANYRSFRNQGVIWNEFDRGSQVLHADYFGSISNSGTMVAHATAYGASTISVGSSFYFGVTNSGGIYALSDTDSARAVETWYSSPIVNSGTIAARGSGSATAIIAYYGTAVDNESSGAILAQGAEAVAIDIRGGHYQPEGDPPTGIDVLNRGRIEAQSTSAGPSRAVWVSHNSSESMIIQNYGIIRADLAIVSDGHNGITTPVLAADEVTNYAGAVIEGAVSLGLGDDRLINAGQIIGAVDLGDGNDFFDNQAGTRIGSTELGGGNDLYLGGSAADAVTGGQGRDQITGGGGDDLLLGGSGNDILQGDAGNDALYGESGDDRIITSAGDIADGGYGDDRIELGDYNFRLAEGGPGYDQLILPSGGRTLDLQQVWMSNRVSGFEELVLGGGDTVLVRPGDVAGLSGGGTTLTLSGASGAIVELFGDWSEQTPQVQGSVSYSVYQSGGVRVLIATGLEAHLTTGMPSGMGLDPIAVGAAPPEPGLYGAQLQPLDNFVPNGMLVTSDFEISAEEHWRTNGSAPLFSLSSPSSITNFGTMDVQAGANGAEAISAGIATAIVNMGTITSSAQGGTSALSTNRTLVQNYGLDNLVASLAGNSYGVFVASGTDHFVNSGLITVSNDQAMAIGYITYGQDVGQNSGTILAQSSNFIGIGVVADNAGTFTNSGIVQATGDYAAYGLLAYNDGFSIRNDGSIIAHAGAGNDGVAVLIDYSLDDFIDNYGVIEGEIAIRTSSTPGGNSLRLDNHGQINGRIDLGYNTQGGAPANDAIINNGTINGTVSLGSGSDVYDGSHGHQTGVVHGDAGADLLIGTDGADSLDGGDGDDILVGGGGDTLTGGAGRDTFVFNAAGGAAATITDFVSGTDVVDLRDFRPSSVSISGNSIIATSAAGTITINVSGPVNMADVVTTGPSVLLGGAGADTLVAGVTASTLNGGAGPNLLLGSPEADQLFGGHGLGDLMVGGDGDDTYHLDFDGYTIVEEPNGGYDTLLIDLAQGYHGAFVMPPNVERVLGGGYVYGNSLDNVIVGSPWDDALFGGAGNDVINGMDGPDRLSGGPGADVLTGGPGRDLFVDSTQDLNGDTITDFGYDDVLDFRYINPNEFNFELVGSTLHFTGGSLETTNLPDGHFLMFGGAPLGGTELIYTNNLATTNDFDGTGTSDVLWRNDDGTVTDWMARQYDYANLQPNNQIFTAVPADWHIAGTGDFDGDGRSDILWRNDDGTLTDWLARPDVHGQVFTANYANLSKFVPTDWHVVGTGDFNGDGRWDVLWRNDDGTITDWLGTHSGSFIENHANLAISVPQGWSVAGTGDFNGDGRTDVLWRNENGVVTDWLATRTGGFVGNDEALFLPVPASWHVIGTGDFNADGRADVLWRNDNGTITDWLATASGGFVGNDAHLFTVVPNDWHVVAIGRYNYEDTLADILWQNNDGTVTNWLGNSAGGFAPNFTNVSVHVPSTWHVQSETNFM